MRLKTLITSILTLACVISSSVYAQSSSYVSYRASDVKFTTASLYSQSPPSFSGTMMHQSVVAKETPQQVITPRTLVSTVHVYKPFNNTPPSGYSPVMRRANVLDDDEDDLPIYPPINSGNPGEMAPIGEVWVLLFFALVYIAVRNKKQTFKSRAL